MKRHENEQKLTPETKVVTDFKTFWAVIVLSAAVTSMYLDLKHAVKGVVHSDDLDRYSTQIMLLNQPLNLKIPRSKDIMRGTDESGSITPLQSGSPLSIQAISPLQATVRQ